jgi:DmsE family decaheme c-type cytochrome
VNSTRPKARIAVATLAMLVLGLSAAEAGDLYSDPSYAALFAFVQQHGEGMPDGAKGIPEGSGFFQVSNAGAAFGGAYQTEAASVPDRYQHHAALSSPVDFPDMSDANQENPVGLNRTESGHPQGEDANYTALRAYAQQVSLQEWKPPSVLQSGYSHPKLEDAELAALREYAEEMGVDQPSKSAAPRVTVAARNVLDALRELLRGNEKPESTPGAAPDSVPDTAPNSTPHPAPGSIPRAKASQSRPATPIRVQSPADSQYLGTTTCLICHASQADSFGKTLMGRIGKTQPGKFDCENCHGPASVHVKAGGCAACHGDGTSGKLGIPTLAGQYPEYLVPAMKAYISGQRKHALMNTLLSGVGESDLNSIAHYYAGQIPARAQSAPVGDAAAGKAASALCVSCHGEQGISVSPLWPSLAGQDAQYLASAIKEYKNGSRNKAVACAGCHGEGGVSKRPGIPSLAGQTPQALIRAMKAYVGGGRKDELMKAMLSGLSEAELNKIALHYARQTPARAQTPSIGDPSAGKKISEDCATCHGEQGISDNPKFPNLAGQDARYLANALRAYKATSRDFAAMQSATGDLDDRAINDVASYFASLPSAQPELTDSEKNTPSTPDPVLIKNGLVASLDERTINNIATYFSNLRPAHPDPGSGVKNAPAGPQPLLVAQAPHPGGRSLGGIISFRKNDPSRKVAQNNAICLGCHERGDRTYWNGSTHENRGIACTECHTVMRPISRKSALKTEIEMETCFQCHKDRRAQIFRSAHMPLREGKITCTNCHNPHGSATEALLKENSINDTCYKCHAEKRGPFLFEHAPVRENCLSCHDAHGSNTEYMLKVSRPRLCAECHGIGHGSLTNGPRTVETFGRACQNCHTQIHGSNSPSGALLQR